MQKKNEDLLLDNEDLQELMDQLWKDLNEARELKSKAEERVEELYVDLKLVKEENAHLSQYVEKLEELEKLENAGNKLLKSKKNNSRELKLRLKELYGSQRLLALG